MPPTRIRTLAVWLGVGLILAGCTGAADDTATSRSASPTEALTPTPDASTPEVAPTEQQEATVDPTPTAEPTSTPDPTPTVDPTPSDDATAGEPSAEASEGPTQAAVTFEDPQAQAAAEAWATVFDSTIEAGEKAPYLADIDQVRDTVDAYGAAGESLGGISLSPTDVTVAGDSATVTYDILFGGQAAYNDQTGELTLTDDNWSVSTDTFCAFMSTARVPCS